MEGSFTSEYIDSGTVKALCLSRNKEHSNKAANSGILLCPGIQLNILTERNLTILLLQ